MNKSDSITDLAAALAATQAEMPPAPMNSVNPFLKNKYADLGAIIKTCAPIMAKHGLSVTQHPYSDGATIGVTTLLMHKSGQWLESELSMPLADERGKSSAQVAGSIITYLRRYALASVLGMYADEDTDGHTEGGKTQPERTQAQPTKTVEKPPANGNGKPAAMTYEIACAMVGGDGKKYGDLPNEELANKTTGINTELRKKDISAEKRAELKRKFEAIGIILKERNNGGK
jgi:hypothetical protein